MLPRSLISLLYPSFCLHCRSNIHKHYLCPPCLDQLDLIDPLFRCPICFTTLGSSHERVCQKCRQKRAPLKRKAAVFDGIGPARALLDAMKKRHYLTRGAAAFLALQWNQLEWEAPDLIIPAPLSLHQKMKQGFDHNVFLAKQLSKHLAVPWKKCLSYRFDETIKLKRGSLNDKALLLIHSEIKENSCVLDCAASTLIDGCPRAIYGLAFCRL